MSTVPPQALAPSTLQPPAHQERLCVLANESTERLKQAFRLGRVLSELNFFIQQVWLAGFSHPHSGACGRLFDELRALAGALAGMEHRNEVQRFIDGGRQGCESNLDAEWHAEELFSLDQARYVVQLTNSPEIALHDDIRNIAQYVTDLLDNLRLKLFSYLPHCLQQVIDLGAAVAEAQFRPNVFRFVVERAAGPNASEGSIQWGGNADHSPSTIPWFNWKVVQPGELRPPDYWLREVQTRWHECGLPELNLNGRSLEVNSRNAVDELVQTVETAFSSGVDELDRLCSRNEPLSPGYLGLVLDRKNGTLTREQRTEKVDLTPFKMAIISTLMTNRDSMTSRGELERIWRDDDRVPATSTIDNELSDLRGTLEPLGVIITNRREVGWRLDDISASPKSRKRATRRK
jgi:DNA-binding winged helix-turn-helix (wHTH) protein